MPKPYIGRFAPSPTGDLHFGSLVSALASFLDARSQSGLWLVRMEDMDPPREQKGAAQSIIHTLKAYHLFWDAEILYQSQNLPRYEAQLKNLQSLMYPCVCTRARIRELQGVYDGHCAKYPINMKTITAPSSDINTGISADIRTEIGTHLKQAWRIKVNSAQQWSDGIQGLQNYDRQAIGGDFIVRRRDQLLSYQIAVTVDDHDQNITHVVRGADLLQSTARQCYLMHCLEWQPPQYSHIPMATHPDGSKLSKQTQAPPLQTDLPSVQKNLFKALQFLWQQPPDRLQWQEPQQQLQWAIAHWNINAIPAIAERSVN